MKTALLYGFLVLFVVSDDTYSKCTLLKYTNPHANFSRKVQGNWILYQNSKMTLNITNDTVSYFFEGKAKGKNLFKVSWQIVSTITKDTLTGLDERPFLEEIDMVSKEVLHQYSLISYSRYKFVLSPIHTNQLLTYNRKR